MGWRYQRTDSTGYGGMVWVDDGPEILQDTVVQPPPKELTSAPSGAGSNSWGNPRLGAPTAFQGGGVTEQNRRARDAAVRDEAWGGSVGPTSQQGTSWTVSGGGYGGGGMQTSPLPGGGFRTQFAQLSNLWNQPVSGNAQQMAGQIANQMTGMQTPGLPDVQFSSPGAMPNQMMGQYQQLLANPGSMASNPFYTFARDQALQAAQRQLSSQRMSKSGNALQAVADRAQGVAGQQFQTLAGVYGQGAQLEGQRYGTEAQVGLQSQQLNNQAQLGLGQLGNQQMAVRGQTLAQALQGVIGAGQLGLSEKGLDLQRVMGGIQTQPENAAQTLNTQLAAYQAGINRPSSQVIPGMGSIPISYATPQMSMSGMNNSMQQLSPLASMWGWQQPQNTSGLPWSYL